MLVVCGGKFLELEDVIVRNLCLNCTFESESWTFLCADSAWARLDMRVRAY